MTTLFADDIEINIEEGHWRLFKLQGANSLHPFFDVLRGSGLIEYATAFGDARSLPGTVLAGDYVKAVVVGFDERYNRWTLGLHVQTQLDEKARFIELVHWAAGDDEKFGSESHLAGRVLAEYIPCPLKLFGAKKSPLARPDGTKRPGVTGPLEPHRREDMDIPRVRLKAESIQLPITRSGVWIGTTRDTLNMRLSKEADQGKGLFEAPAFNQFVFDRPTQVIRLMPPTGLLGGFLGPQGRVIQLREVRNVELRHTVLHKSTVKQDSDGMATDNTQTTHLYGAYLTLADESILVAQLHHALTSDLTRHRIKTGISAGGKGAAYNSDEEMAYLRLHQSDQSRHDATSEFMESVAVVLAAGLGRPLVKTEVGADALA